MKVLVLGAAGRTGRLVVEEALAAGHEVTALTLEPAEFAAGVREVVSDATGAAAIERAMIDQDAVIDVVGETTPYLATGTRGGRAGAGRGA